MPAVQTFTGCALRPRGVAIDKTSCNEIARVPVRNREKCCGIKCVSPWRFCITCVSEGFRELGVVDTKNPTRIADGLCDVHAEKAGKVASPPRLSGGVIPAEDVAARLSTRPLASPAAPAPAQTPVPASQPVLARPISRLEARLATLLEFRDGLKS